MALEKLLHYDLAAKYWHLGRLDPTDLIKDGFYDTGIATLTGAKRGEGVRVYILPILQISEN